jgi:hypothetical protein
MRKHKLPLTVFSLLLILALATVGVSYGLWSKTLTINGTVYTGSLDARWTFASCAEFYPWPTGGNTGEFEGKDIGSVEAWIDQADDQLMHVVVRNAYPSYAADCQVHFMVEGTIPVIVRGTGIFPGPGLTNCELTGANTKTLTCDQITIKFYDNLGTQLHPGDEAASSLMFHIEQPAEMNATYTFDVGICMAQWNEAATAEQCFEAGR